MVYGIACNTMQCDDVMSCEMLRGAKLKVNKLRRGAESSNSKYTCMILLKNIYFLHCYLAHLPNHMECRRRGLKSTNNRKTVRDTKERERRHKLLKNQYVQLTTE